MLTLAAVQFTSIVNFMVIMPLGPQLRRTLDITTNQFGVVVSSYTLAAGLAGLVASSLIDRLGRRAAFLGLYVGFLLGTLLCGLAPSYPLLLAARVVTGAFGGILGGLAMTIIGDVFPYERRGRATGALMSAFSLASIVGVPFGLYLGNEFGWHAPFLLLAGLGCPVLALGMRALPPLRGHLEKKGDAASASPMSTMVAMYTEPNHLRAFALTVTMMLGTFTVVPYISVYFVANVGVDEAKLPLIYIVGGALSLVASPIFGGLADRYGKLRVYRLVAPASVLLMLVLTNLPKVGLILASVTFAALMASNAGRMVAAFAMITGSVESRWRGGFIERQRVGPAPCGRPGLLHRRPDPHRRARRHAPALRPGGPGRGGLDTPEPLARGTAPPGQARGPGAGRPRVVRRRRSPGPRGRARVM